MPRDRPVAQMMTFFAVATQRGEHGKRIFSQRCSCMRLRTTQQLLRQRLRCGNPSGKGARIPGCTNWQGWVYRVVLHDETSQLHSGRSAMIRNVTRFQAPARMRRAFTFVLQASRSGAEGRRSFVESDHNICLCWARRLAWKRGASCAGSVAGAGLPSNRPGTREQQDNVLHQLAARVSLMTRYAGRVAQYFASQALVNHAHHRCRNGVGSWCSPAKQPVPLYWHEELDPAVAAPGRADKWKCTAHGRRGFASTR